MRKSPRRGLQRVQTAANDAPRRLGRRASSGMVFAWFDWDRNHRRPLPQHLGGSISATILGGGHHHRRERDRAGAS